MTKNNNLILGENKEKAYTLLAILNSACKGEVIEYVVAWCYNKEEDYWCQGHYYKNLTDAMDFMYSEEVINMIMGCMKYLDSELPEETNFKCLEDDELKSYIIDGLYQ